MCEKCQRGENGDFARVWNEVTATGKPFPEEVWDHLRHDILNNAQILELDEDGNGGIGPQGQMALMASATQYAMEHDSNPMEWFMGNIASNVACARSLMATVDDLKQRLDNAVEVAAGMGVQIPDSPAGLLPRQHPGYL